MKLGGGGSTPITIQNPGFTAPGIGDYIYYNAMNAGQKSAIVWTAAGPTANYVYSVCTGGNTWRVPVNSGPAVGLQNTCGVLQTFNLNPGSYTLAWKANGRNGNQVNSYYVAVDGSQVGSNHSWNSAGGTWKADSQAFTIATAGNHNISLVGLNAAGDLTVFLDDFTLTSELNPLALLPSSTDLSLAAVGTLDLYGVNQSVATLSDSGGGGGVVTNSSGSATLTINPSSGSTSFSGAIRGPIGLVKTGIATQVLAGASEYTGGTAVSNGALLVNGSITGAVSVSSGATLGGMGGAITGSVNYATGAFALFTNGVAMTFAGTVTLNDNVVRLALPDNLPAGTYLLATNTTAGFTGAFATAPVIASGSLQGAFSTNIVMDASSVRLFAPAAPTILLSPATLPGGIQNVGYSRQITAIGGTAPYTYTHMDGTLPSGLTLTSGGLLSGTPDTVGTYNFTVQATDNASVTGSNAYTVIVMEGPFQDALVGYWNFDGYTVTGNNPAGMVQAPSNIGTEGYFNDLSGNGHLAFGADWGATDTVPYAPTGGKFSGAFYSKSDLSAWHHGCLATVSNTAAITFSQEDFTISFWEKSKYRIGNAGTWKDGQGRSYFFTKAPYITAASTESTEGFSLEIGPTASLVLESNDLNNFMNVGLRTFITYPAWPTNMAPDSGAWVHRTLTGKYVPATDSYTVASYENGAAVGTTVSVTNSIIDNPGVLTIGGFFYNNVASASRFISWSMTTNAAVDPGEAWMDDFAMFQRTFTGGEAKAAYSLGAHADLQYPMSNVIQLLDLHLAGSGTVTIGSLEWSYATGLTGTEGVVAGTFPDFELRLTAGGTGVRSAAGAEPFLTYVPGNLDEAPANDGSVPGSIVITLENDTFTADVVSAGHVTAANVPAGLTANFVRDSDTQITLSFGANAASHAGSNSVTDLTVAFDNDAFTASTAAEVTDSTNDSLSVTFCDPGALSYSRTSLTEAEANDGSVPGSIVITLNNDTFTADAVSGGYVTAANVPAGLSANFVRDSDTQITLSFGANASPHDAGANVTNLTVAFANGAFADGNAGAVAGSTRNDLKITFYTTRSYAAMLRAYWTFDGYTVTGNNPADMVQANAASTGTEGYFDDMSGNGQLAFGADWSAGNTAPYAPTGGKFSGAFYSKSPTADQHKGCLATVSNTAAITFNQEDFTISFWEKSKYRIGNATPWTAGQGRSLFFTKAPYITDGSTDGFGLNLGPTARLDLLANDLNNDVRVIQKSFVTYPAWPPNLAPDSGAWVCRALTGRYVPATDSYTVTAYENGAAVGGTVAVPNSIIDNPGILTIGAFYRNNGLPYQHHISWSMTTNAAVDPGEAWMDDFAMFQRTFTAGEAKAAYSLGNHAGLQYPMSNVIQLLDLHLAGSGTVTIGSLEWSYATGLTGTPGEVEATGFGKYTVVIDGAAGTGVTSSPLPRGSVFSFR